MPLRYGSPGRRTLALALDSSLFIVPGVIGLWLLGGHQLFSAGWHLLIYKQTSAKSLGPLDPERLLSGAATRTAVIKLAVLGVLVVGGYVAWVVYRVGALTWRGATLGKWVFGLKVVCEESPHCPPPLRRSFGRWAVPQAVGILPIPCTGFLPYLWALRDPRHQGGHDKAARTLVILHRPALAATACLMCAPARASGTAREAPTPLGSNPVGM